MQDPELEARVQRLKAEQMEREYQKMTSNVECQVSSVQSFQTGFRSLDTGRS